MNITLNPVSKDLIIIRYISRLPWLIIPMIAAILWTIFGTAGWWGISLACVLGLFLIWQVWLIPKQVHNLGWLETEEDLLITKGKLWHTFTVVPYGRVQYVDLSQGPLERIYGLKTLKLNTASVTSDAKVRGLLAEEADQLRERVSERAKKKMIDL
ncbi:MAG: PH domain-containing protein [Corynebacterium sp.]|uniref:PH domain-containing protein n=1 Tax=Corynebacterium sp. TaxID=1720 RepID=UPI0026DBEFA3|nr:PH domain-containing protein [Corynebacterium sp.]MDO4762631.1 PH domain-containing protein [Corynebacterium sp.]